MKKVIVYIIVTICIMAILFGTIDFIRIKNFKMPYFCIKTKILGDVGSGVYMGLGYSMDIYREYLEDIRIFGISRYNFKILGIEILNDSIN